MKVFNRFNVCGVLRISEAMMMTWLMVIEENYHMDNPYHNATHAADVMQSTAYLMRRELLTVSWFRDCEKRNGIYKLNFPWVSFNPK